MLNDLIIVDPISVDPVHLTVPNTHTHTHTHKHHFRSNMHMSFHFGVNEIILFDEWNVVDWPGIGWSMLGIILLVTLYEGLKSYRDHLYIETARYSRLRSRRPRTALLFSKVHLVQTVGHVLQLIIGYFLMLIFMTYNVWLCLAVAIGTAVGYWLFSWEKSSGDNIDCCF